MGKCCITAARQQDEAFWSAALGFPSQTSDCRGLSSGRLRWLEVTKNLASHIFSIEPPRWSDEHQIAPLSWRWVPYPEFKEKKPTELNPAIQAVMFWSMTILSVQNNAQPAQHTQVTVAMIRDPLAQLQSWRKAAESAEKYKSWGLWKDRFTCTIAILKVWWMKTSCDSMTVIKGFGGTKEDNDIALQLQEFAQKL